MSILHKAQKARQIFREQGWLGLKLKVADRLYVRGEERKYAEFVRRNEISESRRNEIREKIKNLTDKPLISVLLPVYNTNEKWLRHCIDSVRAQLYSNWELCIADDASTEAHIRPVLEEYAATDARINVVFRDENGHISAASNSALELVTGEFVVLLDHDDEFSEDALFWVAVELNAHPDTRMIYSDEDLIDRKGRRFRPKFKPDWSPDLFLSLNLVTHLLAFRTAIIRSIGGFRIGFEGSQDYDLVLRVIERIDAAAIRHIPRILYHWRAIRGSVALSGGEKPYAHERAREAIREHLTRTGRRGTVIESAFNHHRVRWELSAELPLVSLIFVGGVNPDATLRSAEKIVKCTDYDNLEVLIVTNSDELPVTGSTQIKYLFTERTGHAEMLNFAASFAAGRILCFADAAFRPLASDWLREMVGWATQENIGAVGAKLLYRDWTVMLGGLIVGVGDTIGIAHKGRYRGALGNLFRNLFPSNFSAVSACFMAIEKRKFDEVGRFDTRNLPEHLFDADLCLRLREHGLHKVFTPFAELMQVDESVPVILSESPDQQEKEFFSKKWRTVIDRDPFYNPNLSKKDEGFSIGINPQDHI